MALKEPSPRVLILYSNPGETSRLRLDKEHRAIDGVLAELGLSSSLVKRLHAVSVEDFARLIQSERFEILHFSGHGSEEGIYLERDPLDSGELVDARRLAAILRNAPSTLRALVFLSCFSSASLHELATAAPYVITTTGPADDDACIDFVKAFYRVYFEHRSIESAYKVASDIVEYLGHEHQLDAVLTRRAMIGKEAKALCTAPLGGGSVLIDLSQVEERIPHLAVSRERFLSILSRKIRIHKWIFDQPRERTLLSIGPYFGEFSWQSADDPIVCLRLLQLRPEADEKTVEVWASLLVGYNDQAASDYRQRPDPASPAAEKQLEIALGALYGMYRGCFETDERSRVLREAVPEHFKLANSLVSANLQHADSAFHRGDLGRTVAYLEGALTAIHDLIDALADVLTIEV